MKLTFCAPCIFGLEGYCANEFRFLGLENVRAENGRVLFDGDFAAMARANINARYAERIQILLAEFRATTFEQLFEGVRRIRWADYIGMSDAFPVKGSCLSSQLMSVPDCQRIIKKAVAASLSGRYMLSWFEETGAVHQIQFLIMNNRVSIDHSRPKVLRYPNFRAELKLACRVNFRLSNSPRKQGSQPKATQKHPPYEPLTFRTIHIHNISPPPLCNNIFHSHPAALFWIFWNSCHFLGVGSVVTEGALYNILPRR